MMGVMLELGDEDIRRMDEELVRLTRGYVRERLGLGLVLDRLGLRFRELGFRRFDLYVRERASQSPGWCASSRALAGRLHERPQTSHALLTGRIGWSLAELLARHSGPDDEAELLEASRGMTIREVRTALRERGVSPEEEEEEEFVTISLPASAEEVIGLEGMAAAIHHINGGVCEPGLWLECALFEATSTLLEVRPDLDLDFRDCNEAGLDEAGTRGQARRREARAEAERCASPKVERISMLADAVVDLASLEVIETDDLRALDRMVIERAARLASRDVWLGALLGRFLAARGWARLGYASEQHYFDERLGIARSTALGRVTLVKRMEWLEGLSDSLQSGEVGYEQASLIARVASPDSLDGWIARARGRTYEHLREEVAAAKLLARVLGEVPRGLEPPSAEELEVVQHFERDVLSGEAFARSLMEARAEARRDAASSEGAGSENAGAEGDTEAPIQMSADSEDTGAEGDAGDAGAAAPVQMSAGFRIGPRRGSLPVRVRPEVARHFWRLKAAYEQAPTGSDDQVSDNQVSDNQVSDNQVSDNQVSDNQVSDNQASFIFFMMAAFWDVWGPSFFVGNRWKAIHDRDRHRCASPVCNSRNATNHHLRYRSHGGGDEMDNQITVCDFCHLEGEHGGRLKVRGTASALSWSFGRPEVLRVEGRRKL